MKEIVCHQCKFLGIRRKKKKICNSDKTPTDYHYSTVKYQGCEFWEFRTKVMKDE